MTKFENFNKTLRNLEEMNRVNPPYDVSLPPGFAPFSPSALNRHGAP